MAGPVSFNLPPSAFQDGSIPDPTGGWKNSVQSSGSTSSHDITMYDIANNTPKYQAQKTLDLPPSTFYSSSNDFFDRQYLLGADEQKVSLVGRTGEGSRGITSGESLNAIQGALGTRNNGVNNTMDHVTFLITPDLTENGSMIIAEISDTRAAASISIYMGSPSRSFGVNAKLVSRTPQEADLNFKNISLLKAWRMPVLNLGESHGAEPETLRLYGYSAAIRGIPVMLQGLNIEYSSEVDYIQTSDKKAWVPIIQTVSLQLKEVRSAEDLGSFDYTQYKAGTLWEW